MNQRSCCCSWCRLCRHQLQHLLQVERAVLPESTVVYLPEQEGLSAPVGQMTVVNVHFIWCFDCCTWRKLHQHGCDFVITIDVINICDCWGKARLWTLFVHKKKGSPISRWEWEDWPKNQLKCLLFIKTDSTWLSTVQQHLRHHNLTLPKAVDMAQNCPQFAP